MPCMMIDGAVVCTATVDRMEKRRKWCPTCKRRTTMLSSFAHWYGWHYVCLRCGEEWEDWEMLPRPFASAWRKRSVERARKRWKDWQAAEAAGRKG